MSKPIFFFLVGEKCVKNAAEAIDNLFMKARSLDQSINIGIVYPPSSDSGKVKTSLERYLKRTDVSVIHYVRGRKHFKDWNNSQHILDIELFAQKYDPVIYLDWNTVVSNDVLTYIGSFVDSKRKVALVRSIINDFPEFGEKWEGQAFVPEMSLMMFRSACIPSLVKIWESNWKEWIEPAPFVNQKNPAPSYESSILYVGQYSLSQSISEIVKNFGREVAEIVPADLRLVKAPGNTSEKFLLSGSSFSNDGPATITLNIRGAQMAEKKDNDRDSKSKGKGKGKDKDNERELYVEAVVGSSDKATEHVIGHWVEWNEELVFTESVSYADAAAITLTLWEDVPTKNGTAAAQVGAVQLSLLPERSRACPRSGDGGESANSSISSTSFYDSADPPVRHHSLAVLDEDIEKAVLEVDTQYVVEPLFSCDDDDDDEGMKKASLLLALYLGCLFLFLFLPFPFSFSILTRISFVITAVVVARFLRDNKRENEKGSTEDFIEMIARTNTEFNTLDFRRRFKEVYERKATPEECALFLEVLDRIRSEKDAEETEKELTEREAREEALREKEERERVEAERKAEKERKAKADKLSLEKKREAERVALEKKKEAERLALEKKKEQERLALERRKETEKRIREKAARDKAARERKKIQAEEEAKPKTVEIKKNFNQALQAIPSAPVRTVVERSLQEMRQSNPDVNPKEIEALRKTAMVNVTNAPFVRKADEPALTQAEAKFEENLVKERVIPNPYVDAEIEVAPMTPILLDDFRKTQKVVEDKSIPIAVDNPDSVFRIFGAIAKMNGMSLVMDSTQQSKDSVAKRVDFSLQSGALTEDSLFLMGSEDPEHQVKALSIKLNRNYADIPTDSDKRVQYVQELKNQLATAHGVSASDIIIHSIEPGSQDVTYTVRHLDKGALDGLGATLKAKIPDFQEYKLHAAFVIMNLNPGSFEPKYNRDFGVDANCVAGEKRGGLEYFPPKGYLRFGLKVTGKYDNGNDDWLAYDNREGEWAVMYHGTPHKYVGAIIDTPLQAGTANVHGKGIYCSGNIVECEFYAQKQQLLDIPIIGGTKQFIYIFQCRVNSKSIHYCTEKECPLAEDNRYTLHKTTRKDYWFVNQNNRNFENIRVYGLLVKEHEEKKKKSGV